ncbi:hypothetical protein QFZ87_001475 [Bacillus sp. SLBN-46]|nr:paeninodin family lasso peptide [Bacillus sp. SLBN-46]MDR6121878.1 hypothetical protein [Bacillus sp. SLBN-46]
MKKVWQKPVLEILDVNMTMLDPINGQFLDKTLPEGTPRDSVVPSWRS